MPVVEPVVSEEKLRQLLDEQHESDCLDYKRTVRLKDTRDVVELAKDVGAMQIDGGFIVIGADNNGVITNDLTDSDASLLDEATVRPKLARYLPEPFEIRCAVHNIDGKPVALIYVAPNVSGFCIFKATGNYDNGTAFRAGDVYARHGTSREPWNQSDIQKIFEKRVRLEKEIWRHEFAAHIEQAKLGIQTQVLARAPASALTWQLDEETFIGTVIEQLRIDDKIPITLFMSRLRTEANELLVAGHNDDFLSLVDRLTCLVALFIKLDRPAEFERSMSVLNKIYNLGFGESGYERTSLTIKSSKLWLEIIRRIYSLGALAVREERWNAVRLLILQRPKGLVFGEYYNNWLRHALTMAARSGDLLGDREGRKVELPLLSLCQQTALSLACLSSDVDAEDLLDSIVQFDVYFNIAALTSSTHAASGDYYPNFARFYSRRSDPAFRTTVEEPSVRSALRVGDDASLASSLRKLFEAARQESFRYSGWDGVRDPMVRKFLDEHPDKN